MDDLDVLQLPDYEIVHNKHRHRLMFAGEFTGRVCSSRSCAKSSGDDLVDQLSVTSGERKVGMRRQK